MDHKLNRNQSFVLWKEAGITSGRILQHCCERLKKEPFLWLCQEASGHLPWKHQT